MPNADINGDYNTDCERSCNVRVGELHCREPGKEQAISRHPAYHIAGHHQEEVGKQGHTAPQFPGPQVQRMFDRVDQRNVLPNATNR